MKRFAIISCLFIFVLFIGCSASGISEDVDMSNIDEHLGLPGVVYIDVREPGEIEAVGFIEGFERVSLVQDLIAPGFLDSKSTWTFAASDILDEASLRALFDENKTFYIMCRSGIRSGYLVDVLEYLGYEHVHNIGGIDDYEGDRRVFP